MHAAPTAKVMNAAASSGQPRLRAADAGTVTMLNLAAWANRTKAAKGPHEYHGEPPGTTHEGRNGDSHNAQSCLYRLFPVAPCAPCPVIAVWNFACSPRSSCAGLLHSTVPRHSVRSATREHLWHERHRARPFALGSRRP